ncbi:MAG TPA: hypothetical protein VKA46_33635 [Gemmataceae bacterium]|nr:hypothetical protein [Gemmataceae bacterium]
MNEQATVPMSRSGFPLWFGIAVVSGLLALPAVGLGQKKEEQKEEPLPRVWIYRDMPGTEEKDTRTASERYFTPSFFFPESKASEIVVDPKMPVSKLESGGEGTCVEFAFGLKGVDDWAGAGFIPGDKLGDKSAFNVAEKLLVGFGRPVHLKFRARTKDGQIVKARFESCGVKSGDLRDGIELPQTPKPAVTTLGAKWQDVSIELTKKAAGLDKVVCPLKVVVRANENAGKEQVTVYVDDIRFEIGDKKDDK